MQSPKHPIQSAYHFWGTSDDVFRELEHNGPSWRGQDSITVRFRDTFSADYQLSLHARTIAGSSSRRDDRLDWVSTQPQDFHREVVMHVPTIHVPESPDDAIQTLQLLYAEGHYEIVSKAFPQFVASIGEGDPYLILAYLSEINLAMRHVPFKRDRVRKAIEVIAAVRPDNGPDALYCRANAHSGLGERNEAKQLYQQAIELCQGALPEIESQCWKNLGSECEAEGDTSEACRCYEQALSLSPQLMEAHMALAMAKRDAGMLDSALEHFDQVIWTVNDASSTITARGHRLEVYFQLGMVEKAFDDIAVLLSQTQSHSWILPWCARLVFTYARSNDAAIGKVIRFWDAYLRIAPKDLKAIEERLKCLACAKMQGQLVTIGFSQFEAEVTAVIADDASLDAAHLWDRVGHWAQIDGDWQAAELYYRRAYNLDPKRYGYCLGTALNSLKRFDESLPILLAQANIHQPDAKSWFQVAIAREGIRDIDGGKEAFRRALDLDPEYAAAMFNLGGILWNSGNHDEALSIWTEALGRFPNDILATQLKEQFAPLFGDDIAT